MAAIKIKSAGKRAVPWTRAMVTLTPEVQTILKQSSAKLQLSPRSYHRLIKVARTIADLDNAKIIQPNHVFEALQYRVKL